MPRPKRILEVLEKARTLRDQLEAALKLLEEHRGSLEALASLRVKPVNAVLTETVKRTRYGEYRYPILMLCPGSAYSVVDCKQIHVTRFKRLAEVFVKAAVASRTLHELSLKARETLALLEELEKLVKELGKEIAWAEELVNQMQVEATAKAEAVEEVEA